MLARAMMVFLFLGVVGFGQQLPCIVAMTDQPSFQLGQEVKINMVFTGTPAPCNGRNVAVNAQGALGFKVGLELQAERTQLVGSPFGQPKFESAWQQVEFVPTLARLDTEYRQVLASFAGLKPGRYRVIASVYDDAGYDFLVSLRFNVQGVVIPEMAIMSAGKPDSRASVIEPVGPQPVNPEVSAYFRPGLTQIINRSGAFRMVFAASLGGAATAEGFLYQLVGQEGRIFLIPTSLATTGSLLGDLPVVMTGPLPSELYSSARVYACAKPDGATSFACGVIYDPDFPASNWGWYGTK